MNPQFVLRVVSCWRKVAAPLGIILAAAAAAIVFLTFKPVYRAVGHIRILESQPHIAFPAQRESGSNRFVATQLQLMRLPIVLYEVAYDPEVTTHPEIREEPDPVDYLQREINVNVIGESEIYQIEYRASDPNHAKQVVDKLIASYIRYVDTHDAERRARLHMALDTAMERRIHATQMLQDEVRRLSEEAGVTPSHATGRVSPQLELDFRNQELLLAQDIYRYLAQQKIQLTTEENAPRRVHSLNGVRGGLATLAAGRIDPAQDNAHRRDGRFDGPVRRRLVRPDPGLPGSTFPMHASNGRVRRRQSRVRQSSSNLQLGEESGCSS